MIFKKGKRIGTYPSCDHLNCALEYLLEKPAENKTTIEEICYAIDKAGGYFYDHIKDGLIENHIYKPRE